MEKTIIKHYRLGLKANIALKYGQKIRGFRTEREYLERLIFEDQVRLEGGEDNTNQITLLNSIHELSVLHRRALERIEIDAATARKFTVNVLGNVLSSQGKTVVEARKLIAEIQRQIDEELDARESK